MPINKKAYRRYKVIDACVRNKMKPYPTLEDLIEAIREKLDEDMSPHTIEMDLRTMRLPEPDGIDAPIKYNRKMRGYEYTDPNYSMSGLSLSSDDIDAIKESVELLTDLGGERLGSKFTFAMEKVFASIKEELPEDTMSRKIVQNDLPPGARGYEHFDIFYKATREKVPVSFIHYSYSRREFKAITVHPMLIKEFQNRWYVIGYSEYHNEIRTFGFDRIYDPLYLNMEFIEQDDSLRESYLNDVYGVFPLREGEKEEIVLKVLPIVANYFQAYPIHESQKIEMKDHGFSHISFQLIPSLELAQLILSYGDQVRVEQPERLKKYIKNIK